MEKTLDELRAELTKRGISFAPNAGAPNLQGKLDEALAKESINTGDAPAGDGPPAPKAVSEVKPGAAKVAAPAAAKAETPAAPAAADAYYEAMILTKRAAGLSLEQATEVTARQRAEDEAKAKK